MEAVGGSGAGAGGVVSVTSGVSVSVGPSQSAELPSAAPPLQFTVEFRPIIITTHMSHMSHVGVIPHQGVTTPVL